MEENKKQTALVYCVYPASGDSIFSDHNQHAHDYRLADIRPAMIQSRIDDVIQEIQDVMYAEERERHIFYLPFTKTIRKELSNHNIQFHTIIPKANCMHEWVGRMVLGRYPKEMIDDAVNHWTEEVHNIQAYPNEMIVRLSYDKQLSNIPVKNLFDEKEHHVKEEKRKEKIKFIETICIPFLIYASLTFILLLTEDTISDISKLDLAGLSVMISIAILAYVRLADSVTKKKW